MAVVEFKRKTLQELVGKKLTEEDLEHTVPMMGCDVEEVNKETVKYEVFPDRPDILSEEGFSRALRYFLDIEKGLPEYDLRNSGVKLKKEKVKARPCITGAIVKNVEINDELLRSLMQVQEKLHITFGRERRKIAIGIHDLDQINPPFTYKAVNPGKYSFTPLGHEEEMTLKEIQEKHEKGKYADILEGNKKWPVIEDSEGYTLSFPPVINGKKTELTPETQNIFIDVTGTDQEAIDKALNIIATTLTERKGHIEYIEIEELGRRPDLSPGKMKVDLDYVNKMLGMSFTEKRFKELLEGMGYGYEDNKVLTPPYRTDIMHPIDIVEDIAIKYGYKEFERELPEVPTLAQPHRETEKEEKVKDLLTGFGYQEVKNTILTDRVNQFEKIRRKEKEPVELSNPLDANHKICRVDILPQLLKNLSSNQHRSYPQEIFETGNTIHLKSEEETGVKMKTKLALAKIDTRVNYNELTSMLDSLMNNLDIDYSLKKSKGPAFIKGRQAKVMHDGETIGIIGEIHPEALNNWGVEKPVIAGEINLDPITKTN